jgi:hypothetical protein
VGRWEQRQEQRQEQKKCSLYLVLLDPRSQPQTFATYLLGTFQQQLYVADLHQKQAARVLLQLRTLAQLYQPGIPAPAYPLLQRLDRLQSQQGCLQHLPPQVWKRQALTSARLVMQQQERQQAQQREQDVAVLG